MNLLYRQCDTYYISILYNSEHSKKKKKTDGFRPHVTILGQL
jgi:hypothetical protein